ncbi:hypothetical protein BWI15_00435 [Kribbella sp. ALI-6-A]|uniref:hypothetical protein n=1 Tax=Kribbella sp. ALI-6-A TaxID=1933817 RepID=UPI00097BBDD3|nr:hypothetical protein [Kribbella sp. ALI-6-A]ONI79076.1 hypothetical protein BWI15_00435 [Kribbella sp. ALI-6-A]
MAGILRSKAVIVAAAALALVVLAGVTIARWQESEDRAPQVAAVDSGDGGSPRLKAWARPNTTDPKVYAAAYATAIWTYDSTVHGYFEWQGAVKMFADPMDTGGPRVAGSMLPDFAQWEQLDLHDGKATVSDVSLETPPELARLERLPQTPSGWHGFVVRGRQTNVIDGAPRVAARSVTVAVVCASQCRFWSASAEGPA